MEVGSLFFFGNDSRFPVEQLMEAIKPHNEYIDGYVYENVQTLVT